MKKLFATLLCIGLCVSFAHKAEAGGFGAKGGLNLTSLNFSSGTPTALGYSFGVTYQMDLPMGFAVQPDFLYHVKSTTMTADSKDTFGLGYLEVPVNIQWGIRLFQNKIRLFAQLSPYVGYAVTQTGVPANSEDNVIFNPEGGILADVSKAANKWLNVNRFSYGSGLGLGIQLWGVQLTAQYCWNFGRLSSKEIDWKDYNNKNFDGYAVSMAIMFGRQNWK